MSPLSKTIIGLLQRLTEQGFIEHVSSLLCLGHLQGSGFLAPDSMQKQQGKSPHGDLKLRQAHANMRRMKIVQHLDSHSQACLRGPQGSRYCVPHSAI